MKICSNVPGHMIKMVSKYMYVKTFKNLLLRNQEADGLEIWYTASGTQVLPNFQGGTFVAVVLAVRIYTLVHLLCE